MIYVPFFFVGSGSKTNNSGFTTRILYYVYFLFIILFYFPVGVLGASVFAAWAMSDDKPKEKPKENSGQRKWPDTKHHAGYTNIPLLRILLLPFFAIEQWNFSLFVEHFCKDINHFRN